MRARCSLREGRYSVMRSTVFVASAVKLHCGFFGFAFYGTVLN
jgi:hypothetical protein